MFPRNAGKAEELQGFDWMCDFALGAEVLSHVNELNLEVVGEERNGPRAVFTCVQSQANPVFSPYFPMLVSLNEPPSQNLCSEMPPCSGQPSLLRL